MMPDLTTGKLVFHYVGEYGKHTELYVNDELVAAGFNCDKSIMLLLWCSVDMIHGNINDYIDVDFTYEPTALGTKLCSTLFKPQLFSKYDVLMEPRATGYAYRDIVYKRNLSPSAVLSARRDIILHMQKRYKIDKLEVIYELDTNEIYADG